MRKFDYLLALGAIATLAIPVTLGTPVGAQLKQAGQTLVQTLQQPQVNLQLSAAKKAITLDPQGQPVVTWQPLEAKATVQSGDQLRYRVDGKNQGNRPAEELAVIQPIPIQMQYVLNSAIADQNLETTITYSIDNGQSFVANPTIEVRQPDGTIKREPAPADAYTHIRWEWPTALAANAEFSVSYDVEVR